MKNKTILRNDNILKLSNGRRLSYAEYGTPDGQPIFLVHDTPGANQGKGVSLAGGKRYQRPQHPGSLPGRDAAQLPDNIHPQHRISLAYRSSGGGTGYTGSLAPRLS